MSKIIPYVLLIGGESFNYDGYCFQPPTLQRIIKDNEGENYNLYLYYSFLLSCSKEDIIDMVGVKERYNKLSFELQNELTKYKLLLLSGGEQILQEAIQFFVKDKVVFNEKDGCFFLYSNNNKVTKIIDNSNFIEFCNYVNQINYRDTVEEDEPIENMTFSSEKAKQRYIELQKRKKQFNKNKAKNKEGNANFDLGNVIAKLSAKTNSPYNLTNIYNLTVFQLYDQFYQTIQNNQIDGYVLKWAAWGSEEFDFSLWYNNNKTK